MENKANEVTINQTRLRLLQGEITRQATEAIVNAANPSLMGGGGVDGAIHQAGGPAILAECKQIVAQQGRLPTGKAVITTGGNLKAKYVIHTVGPVWNGGHSREPDLLACAYRESLKLATEHKLASIAFPSISTGVYGYPTNQAARVAIAAVITFLRQGTSPIREVLFVLFDSKTLDDYSLALREAATELGLNPT